MSDAEHHEVLAIEGDSLAIVSDVHGNSVALRAVIDDMTDIGVNAMLSLGDVAATGPSPRESLRALMKLKTPSVMGNTDERILRPEPSKFNSKRGPEIPAIDSWCASQLDGDDSSYVSSFKPLIRLQFGGKDILCYHGSPRSNTEVIDVTTAEDVIHDCFAARREQLFAGGHTHVQMLRRYGSSQIINPGSVGLPYDIGSDGTHYRPVRAEYAIVEMNGAAASVRFRRVPYDLDELARTVESSGMPHSEWWMSKWKRK